MKSVYDVPLIIASVLTLAAEGDNVFRFESLATF